MSQHFHPLTITDVNRETPDCISVAFAVPDELRETYRHHVGQYLVLKAEVGDRELRRAYSLCSTPRENELRVAIKRVDGGMFSQWAHALLRAGEQLEVLPPDGLFIYEPKPEQARKILLLAAGSGITPIFAILKTILETEPLTQVTLVYGNRKVKDIIFKEALEDLRDRYLTRFQLLHTLSGELQDAPIANGRLDAAKVDSLFGSLVDPDQLDGVYICGPNGMIESVIEACRARMPAEKVHRELFGPPTTAKPKTVADPGLSSADTAHVTVIADGIERELAVSYKGEAILDEALNAGIDVPYSCKAGVCSTCRAQLLEGEVSMDANYTLEQHEIDRGFVLTCQAHPITDYVRISFDAR